MDKMTYEEHMKVQRHALDQIDFLPYIQKFNGEDVWELREAVSNDYDNSPMTENSTLEGDVFNYFSLVELIDYLENRYPNNFRVTEVHKYIINGR